MLVFLAQTPAPTPGPGPEIELPDLDRLVEVCGERPGAVCRRMLDWTDNGTLAELSQWLVDGPLEVALIFLGAWFLVRVTRRLIRRSIATMDRRDDGGGRALDDRKRRATVSRALITVVSVIAYTAATLMALSELGISVGPLLAGAGIAGVALGFGAQNLVRDFLAGIFVVTEDQYRVGDIVDLGIATGEIEDMTLRVTRLRDLDGTLWTIPNGVVERVGNKTLGWARVILDVPVAYDTDVAAASAVIVDTASQLAERNDDVTLLERPEVWGVESLDDSSISIRVVVKVAPGEQWMAARHLRGHLLAALADAGVEIPFPQRVLQWSDTAAAGPERERT